MAEPKEQKNHQKIEKIPLIVSAFNEIFGTNFNPDTDFSGGYLNYSYRDSSGRYAEDVRLYVTKSNDQYDSYSLSLTVNLGPALVLVELFSKFKEKGIKIDRLGANSATPEEINILKALTK